MSPSPDPTISTRLRAAEDLRQASEILLTDHGRIAIYLAGLAVECALKALVLGEVPVSRRRAMDESEEFRGRKGHSYDDLRRVLRRESGGRDIPIDWTRDLRLINAIWEVDMRYAPKRIPEGEATPVWEAASRMVQRIKGRLS
jgi:HEPN domain-containing protein